MYRFSPTYFLKKGKFCNPFQLLCQTIFVLPISIVHQWYKKIRLNDSLKSNIRWLFGKGSQIAIIIHKLDSFGCFSADKIVLQLISVCFSLWSAQMKCQVFIWLARCRKKERWAAFLPWLWTWKLQCVNLICEFHFLHLPLKFVIYSVCIFRKTVTKNKLILPLQEFPGRTSDYLVSKYFKIGVTWNGMLCAFWSFWSKLVLKITFYVNRPQERSNAFLRSRIMRQPLLFLNRPV